MNDESSTALNQTAEVNSPDTTPVSEQTPEEVVETPAVPESTEEGQPENQSTETGGESKKGSSNRIRELANENRTLKQRMAELTGTTEQSFEPASFVPQVAPGAEVSPEQYQQHVLKQADALVTLRLKQTEAVNRINNEANEAMRLHPELDPSSDKFNKELSDSVNDAVEAYVKQNPYSASPLQFVNRMMKPFKGALAKEVGQAQEQIAKQVTQSALRPTSVNKQDKSASEMSIKELEAKLGVVQS